MPDWNQDFCATLMTCFAHLIWQGILLGIVFKGSMDLLRNHSPQARHATGLLFLLIFSLFVPATYLIIHQPASNQTSEHLSANISPEPASVTVLPATNVQNPPVMESSSETGVVNDQTKTASSGWNFHQWFQRLTPYLFGVYLAGVLFFTFRLAFGVYISRIFRRNAIPVNEPEFMSSIEEATRKVGLAFQPSVLWCMEVGVPSVVGVIRPTILLPFACMTSLKPEQIEQILIHELTHIRRYDHLFNLFQNTLEAFLFFHPVVWYISNQVRLEREFCCDAAVLDSGNRPVDYANALMDVVTIAQSRQSADLPLAVTAVKNPSKLRVRIERMMGQGRSPKNRLIETGSLITVSLTLAICCLFAVQFPSHADSKKDKDATEVLEKVDSVSNKIGKEMTLPEILSSYTKEINSIHDLDVQYTREHSSGGGPIGMKLQRSGDLFRYMEDMTRRRISQNNSETTPTLAESGLSYDGHFYYNFRTEDEITKDLQIRDIIDPIYKLNMEPELMLGKYLFNAEMSLSEVLSLPGSQLVGKAKIGDSECWEVKSAPFDNSTMDTKHRLQAYFDPAKNLLPRRILLLDSTDFSKGDKGKWFFDIEITDFKKVEDPKNKRESWYPAKAVVRQAIPNQITYIIQNVKINQGLDKEIFTPKITEEITVMDATSFGEKDFYNVKTQKEFERSIQRLLKIQKFTVSQNNSSNQADPVTKQEESAQNPKLNTKTIIEFRIAFTDPKEGLTKVKIPKSGETIYMESTPFVQDSDFKSILATKDNNGTPAIHFKLKSEAGEKMREVTAKNHGNRFVILIKGVIMQAPIIRATISNSGIMTTDLPEKEVEQIVNVIQAEIKNKLLAEELVKPAGKTRNSEQNVPDEISGTIVDEEGNPIEGVLIDAWTWFTGNETKTDKNGKFKLNPKSDTERPEIRISKEGYSPLYFPGYRIRNHDVLFTLNQKTYIEGQLLDPDGNPVPNAIIRGLQKNIQGDNFEIGEVTTKSETNKSGHYRMYVFPDTYEMVASVSGVGGTRVPDVVVGKNQSKSLDLQLEKGFRFEAKVIDALTRKPVEGVVLWNWREPSIIGKSDSNGNLVIENMLPGEINFNVGIGEPKEIRGNTVYFHGNMGRWWSMQAAYEWEKNRHNYATKDWQRNLDNLSFNLTKDMKPVTIMIEQGVEISGKVLDPDGNPVAGATVAPAKTGSGNSLTGDTRYSATTEKDGTYRVIMPAGNKFEYNLVAHDGKYQDGILSWGQWANGVNQPFQSSPGQKIENMDLQLTRPCTVKGRVISNSGKKVSGLKVGSQSADLLTNRYYDPTTKTNEDGTFELKFIRPGENYIRVEPFHLLAQSGPNGSWVKVNLKEGEILEGIELNYNQ